MSVSHPILKQLKPYIIKFFGDSSNGTQIVDTHPSLLPFCRLLEEVFAVGLRYSAQGERNAWKWIQILGDSYPTYKLTAPLQWCIEQTSQCKQVLTNAGRTRHFLRCSLNKGVLTLVIRLLKEDTNLFRIFYDEKNSIIGNEILHEIFISMIAQLAHCRFCLFIKNASFLDETWELPVYAQYELVPTDRLGVEITIIKGRVIITDVEPGSVADEDAKMEPGDVIDYLFGECMRDGTRRKFAALLRDYRGAPVYICVVKAIDLTNCIYKPLIPLLQEAGLPLNNIVSNYVKRRRELQVAELLPDDKLVSKNATTESTSSSAQRTGQLVDDQGHYPVYYLGHVHVGSTGTIDKIERAVVEVVKRYESTSQGDASTNTRAVLLDLGETDAMVACAKTKQPLFQHGYPEIASCGRRVDYPLNFAYIAGETTCTLATDFVCYVFEANCDEQSKMILKEIARGFDRTHWAV